MRRNIRVYVITRSRSKYLYLKWKDPDSDRVRILSTQTRVRRDAERQALKLEKELSDGTYSEPIKCTWDDFRVRFEEEYLGASPETTFVKAGTMLNAIENHINPNLLKQVNSNAVSQLVKCLREAGRAEATIQSHISYLRVALKWANEVGLIDKLPHFPKLKRAKITKRSTRMKGRPITLEEFERMIDCTPKEIPGKRAKHWQHFLKGIWLSGLRLNEAIHLSWESDQYISIDLSNKYPVFKIPAEAEKGHKDRFTPITPDFAKFILETPKTKRRGFVFKLPQHYKTRERPTLGSASKTISRIGKKANIKVTDKKFASAHDLRRSFGERWSHTVSAADLQQLMRHESIETTLRYYVGQNAGNIAAKLWEAQQGDSSGDTIQKPISCDD